MDKKCYRTAFTFATLAIMLVLSCALGKNKFGQWAVTHTGNAPDGLQWASFRWTGQNMGNRFFDRFAMNIPVRVVGLPRDFMFQFDLGSDVTMIYGENAKSIRKLYPAVNFKKPVLNFGDFTASTSVCYVKDNYGEAISMDDDSDARLGTIGADMFHDKVLIIDYPHQRFAICDSVPAVYAAMGTVAISLDKYGRVLLPMQLRGKNYKVLFDNGSSIFPLLTSAKNIGSFSDEPVSDSIEVTAWGQRQQITGRVLRDSFLIGGQLVSNIIVYANHSGSGEENEYDAITGNALFWDKVIIIDFKNKRFGLR